MSEWKVGDVVELKSGGPGMTVLVPKLGISSETRCGYMVNGEFKTVDIPPNALQAVEK